MDMKNYVVGYTTLDFEDREIKIRAESSQESANRVREQPDCLDVNFVACVMFDYH